LDTDKYHVQFHDTLGQFADEFYDNKPDVDNADDVQVNLGFNTPNINAILDYQVVSVTVPLTTGWNLISLPGTPNLSAPQTILEDIAGTYKVVFAYNGCTPASPWTKYDPLAPPMPTT